MILAWPHPHVFDSLIVPNFSFNELNQIQWLALFVAQPRIASSKLDNELELLGPSLGVKSLAPA